MQGYGKRSWRSVGQQNKLAGMQTRGPQLKAESNRGNKP